MVAADGPHGRLGFVIGARPESPGASVRAVGQRRFDLLRTIPKPWMRCAGSFTVQRSDQVEDPLRDPGAAQNGSSRAARRGSD